MTYEPVTLDHLLAHQTWAIRMARRLVREEGEAEELVQRTWIAALRRPPSSERGARAWIGKVILNLARERHRRDTTRVRHEHASFEAAHVEPDASESASREEIKALLADQLLALNEPYRTVLVQRFYDGLNSVEIAERLNVPAGTVRWRLKVGLDRLRDQLDRRSRGDRSRWVSALLLLAPEGSLPEGEDADAALDAVPPASSPGLTGLAAWTALAAGAAGLGYLLLRDAGGAESPERASIATSVPDGTPPGGLARFDGAPRGSATDLRTPLASGEARSSPAEPASALRIRVVDERGEPVPEAAIVVASADGLVQRARTDADGRASLAVEPADVGALGLAATRGRVSLRAFAPGLAASELLHVAPPFGAEHEVRLELAGPAHAVHGRVLDERGTPVGGAVVAWFDPARRLERAPAGDFPSPSYLATATDGSGAFELDHLTRGAESLYCFAPGFAIGKASPVFTGLRGEVELTLERGAIVSGRITWPGGRPAAGVEVGFEPFHRGSEWATGLPRYEAGWRGFGETALTEGDGRFRLEGVIAGTRTVWARESSSGLVATSALALENGVEERWQAELGEREGFRLRLVDEAGRPLAGWFAHMRRPGGGGPWWVRRRETDAEGRAAILDCPAAEAYLDVFDPTGVGASYASLRLEPAAGERLVTIETGNGCAIEGFLLDADGRPDLHSRLVAFSLRTALSVALERDETGRFAQRLAAGDFSLVLQRERTAVKLAALALAAGETRDLGTLRAPATGTLHLSGAALANGDARTPGYTLFALLEEGRDDRFLNVGHGELAPEAVLPVFPGRYRVLAFDASGAPPREHLVRVEPYLEARLELVP